MLYYWDTVVEWHGPAGWEALSTFDEADGPLEEPGIVAGWRPVVVCGTNEALRRRLASAGVTALGWVDDMAALMADADVLVDNAGGLTSKEALAAGLPVVVFRPIAGHGRDDAMAMAALGVSVVVDDARYLVPVLDRVSRPGHLREEQVRRGLDLFGGDAADQLLALLADLGRPPAGAGSTASAARGSLPAAAR
ncbi:glycosyltransferase [Acidimicrobiaceae bacterium USS-CC1]|uniref:Glycosyltransferase n=1 Tax=Acidiferrimicrobium australe TaxID=2664430 RepID=A0ABW9QY01_9ACTN|nr:glycosyltransferase [Acidiferrimicrobium australe]